MTCNFVQIICMGTLLVLGSGHSTNVDKQYKVTTIAIDAGHGGRDSGACGKVAKEKDISLKVALRLEAILKRKMPHLKVVLTRRKDKFKKVWRRGYIANKNGAQIFISIHCNAAKNKKMRGVEAYLIGPSIKCERMERNYSYNLRITKRENSVVLLEEDHAKKYQDLNSKSPESHILSLLSQNAYNDNSVKLAQAMQRQFEQSSPLRWQGIGQAGLIVLARASKAFAKVLIEIGYITNREEEKYLNSKVGQRQTATCLYKALKEYIESAES